MWRVCLRGCIAASRFALYSSRRGGSVLCWGCRPLKARMRWSCSGTSWKSFEASVLLYSSLAGEAFMS